MTSQICLEIASACVANLVGSIHILPYIVMLYMSLSLEATVVLEVLILLDYFGVFPRNLSMLSMIASANI